MEEAPVAGPSRAPVEVPEVEAPPPEGRHSRVSSSDIHPSLLADYRLVDVQERMVELDLDGVRREGERLIVKKGLLRDSKKVLKKKSEELREEARRKAEEERKKDSKGKGRA